MGRVGPIAAVALVVLAGCNGLGPGSTEPTVTPVPVTGERTSPTPEAEIPVANASLPPGVHGNGTVDLAVLGGAHRDLLANRSYTYRFESTVFATGSSSREDAERGASRITLRAESGTRYLLRIDTGGDSVPRTLYADGQSGYGWDGTDSAVDRIGEPAAVDELGLQQGESMFGFGGAQLFLPDEDVRVTPVERNGETLFRIAVSAIPDGWMELEYERYSLTASVTPDGLIRSVVLEYRPTRDRTRTHRVTYRFTDVGNTTVSEPDRVSALGANASSADPGESRDTTVD